MANGRTQYSWLEVFNEIFFTWHKWSSRGNIIKRKRSPKHNSHEIDDDDDEVPPSIATKVDEFGRSIPKSQEATIIKKRQKVRSPPPPDPFRPDVCVWNQSSWEWMLNVILCSWTKREMCGNETYLATVVRDATMRENGCMIATMIVNIPILRNSSIHRIVHLNKRGNRELVAYTSIRDERKADRYRKIQNDTCCMYSTDTVDGNVRVLNVRLSTSNRNVRYHGSLFDFLNTVCF